MSSARHGSPTTRLDGLRVLLVEDHDDSREFLRVLLLQEGGDVVAVATAEDALALCSALRYDVIVSDLNLPGEDGYALLAAVRAKEQDRDCAAFAVAYTAEPMAHATRALSHGFDYVINKGQIERLLSLLGRVGATLRSE